MNVWNYVVTAHKPTSVSHSCVGNFTSPNQLNLIIAKCTRIEIHLLTPQGLQPMLDVPIYGRIATIELFRPHNETQDFLFIATERYKFCVLQWDAEKSELITRAMGDVSDRIGRPTDNGQIGIIDPGCRLIGLHLYDGLFKVIPFDNKGQLKETFNIRWRRRYCRSYCCRDVGPINPVVREEHGEDLEMPGDTFFSRPGERCPPDFPLKKLVPQLEPGLAQLTTSLACPADQLHRESVGMPGDTCANSDENAVL